MKIVFRVDSSAQIGSGHLMRCLTLAKRLQKEKKADIYFIMRQLEGNLISLVEKQGFSIFRLPIGPSFKNLIGYERWLTVKSSFDAEQTISCIKQLDQVEWLMVDHYAVDQSWERKLRPFVKNIMVIDDLANRQHDCDILLDQNFYLDQETRYNGLVPQNCKLLLGPSYAILRDEFYEARKKMRRRDGSIHNILVSFGGSDLTNETIKTLRAIERLKWKDILVNVVVGKNHPHQEEVRTFCGQHPYMNYFSQINHMAYLMNEADLAIGAGGTTTWERCFLGLPALVIAIAENQVKMCEDCAQRAFILYLGKNRETTSLTIYRAILGLKNKEKLKHLQMRCFLSDWEYGWEQCLFEESTNRRRGITF